jgi:tetratricopeptide (TPR) repeat protein
MSVREALGDTGPLERRVGVLERRLRLYRMLAVAGGLAAVLALLLAVYAAFRTHRAGHAFVLTAPDGRVLAELAQAADGGYGLYLYDRSRERRAWLGLADGGAPRLVLADDSGRTRATLALDSDAGGQPRLRLEDAAGVSRLLLGLWPDGAGGLELMDQQGQGLVRLPPALGASPQERWATLNAAGTRLLAQERMEDAERAYEAALREARALGPEDQRVASTLNNLGVLYLKQQRPEQAEAAMQQALAIRRKALGETHPQVAQTLTNLGFLRQQQGDAEQAETLFAQVVAMLEDAGTVDSTALVQALANHREALRRLGRAAEAAAVDRRIAALRAVSDAVAPAADPQTPAVPERVTPESGP